MTCWVILLLYSTRKNKQAKKPKTMCTSNFGKGTRSWRYPGCVSGAESVAASVPQLKDQRSNFRAAVTRMSEVTGYFVINVTSVRVKSWLSVNSSSSSLILLKTIKQGTGLTVTTVSILIGWMCTRWKWNFWPCWPWSDKIELQFCTVKLCCRFTDVLCVNTCRKKMCLVSKDL